MYRVHLFHSAGMINHDVIIGINGQPIRTTEEVTEAVQSLITLSMLVRRHDGDVTLTVIPNEID